MDIVICLVSAPSREVAVSLATLVVSRKLAACVSIAPGVTSVYRWKGEITLDEEVLMIAKTTRECVERLRTAILAEHPYEIPEFVVLPVSDASEAYAQWVQESTISS